MVKENGKNEKRKTHVTVVNDSGIGWEGKGSEGVDYLFWGERGGSTTEDSPPRAGTLKQAGVWSVLLPGFDAEVAGCSGVDGCCGEDEEAVERGEGCG